MAHVITATLITKAVLIGLSCLTFIAGSACIGGSITHSNDKDKQSSLTINSSKTGQTSLPSDEIKPEEGTESQAAHTDAHNEETVSHSFQF